MQRGTTMDHIKTGKQIKHFRTKMNLTQKQLAELLHVSDKAVSKWECGNGCPDLSMFPALAEIFGTDIQVLLTGALDQNEKENGNMKKLHFYVCKDCGNIITATSDAAVTCCGNKLHASIPRQAEEREMLTVQDTDGEWYITTGHAMTKTHYISFVAYVNDSTVMLFKQYPEWGVHINLPMYRSGKLVWYCSQCGLLWQKISPKRG